jgi:DNA-binding FadR family transcriptional regulator
VTTTEVPVRRVRKAYEQVADQLRELIVGGELARGDRLPNEQVLARQFGVSRATVREALRVLAAQNLIRTAKGAGGGSYVTLPSADHISDFVTSNINLLTEASEVSLDELLEARELLEVPAARLAARRRSEEDVERLVAAIPNESGAFGPDERFDWNKEFHAVLIETSGNSLLTIASQPLFSVLQTNLARSALGPAFHAEVDRQHRLIADAVAAGDADAAGEGMKSHLAYLSGFYEQVWSSRG